MSPSPLFFREAVMSSISSSAPPAPTSNRLSGLMGYVLGVPVAILALISFYLPWVKFIVNGTLFSTLTGQNIAAGVIIQKGGGSEVFRGSAINNVILVVVVIILVSAVLAWRRRRLAVWDGLGVGGMALIGLLVILGGFGSAQRDADLAGVTMQMTYGLFLALATLLLLAVAGFWNMKTVLRERPGIKGTLSAWGFMTPATLLVTIFFFIPALILLILSMTDLASSNFSEPWHFIGLLNYHRMFSDRFFPKILGNTIRYVALTLIFFNVGLALLLALLTSYINRRAGFFFRMLWLLPRITPSVVYIVMWRRMVQQAPFGIINQFLGWFGLSQQPHLLNQHPWLFVIMANGFVGASFGMLIFSSAIESIPKDLFTAAKVDGASTLQIIRDITMPLLKWPLLFVTSYQTLSLLVSFEYILLLTNGGPGLFTTEVWALTSYKRALSTYFGTNQWGYGAAWGLVLVVIAITASVIYLRVFRFDDLVQEPKIDVL